jgi:hypothetical protein
MFVLCCVGSFRPLLIHYLGIECSYKQMRDVFNLALDRSFSPEKFHCSFELELLLSYVSHLYFLVAIRF